MRWNFEISIWEIVKSQKLNICESAQILREGSGTKGKSAQILCAVSTDTDFSLYAELRNLLLCDNCAASYLTLSDYLVKAAISW